MSRDELLAYLKEHLDEMLAFLDGLVRIETPSLTPESQVPALELLADALKALRFRVRRLHGVRSGGHLYAVPAERVRHRRSQLLLGHCDTVWPLGTLQTMPLARVDATVKGPGVYDMKAGLVQMIYALKGLRALGLEPALTPLVFINSDEEIGSKESTRYIRALARIAERSFVLEPSLGPSGKIKTARKGVGRFKVVIKGRAAHAGLNPEAGASAILELSHVIQELFALNDPEKGISVNVGMIDGGLRPNVIAPESSAVVDVRVLTEEDAKRIEQRILNLTPRTPGVRLEIEGGIGRPPMVQTPGNRALWRLARDLGRQVGLELEEGTAGGGSDGNTTSLFTPTLDGLGAVGDGAHASHEFVEIDKMVERSALLGLLLMASPIDS